jgi:NodT family efflux transporter outer membrane factor (OMF) lipoprotein
MTYKTFLTIRRDQGLIPLWKHPAMLVLLSALSGGAAASDIAVANEGATGQVSQVAGREVPSEWGALFQSQHIDVLIKRASSVHPDAGAVQASLQRALAYPVVQKGYFYPAVVAGEPLDSFDDAEGLGAAEKHDAESGYYSFRSAQLTVGYVLGGKQYPSEPGPMQVLMQRDAGLITLASNVAAAAIQEAALRAQIEAQLTIVGLNRQSLEIVHNQFKLGYVSEEDVMQLELGAAQAQQALVPLQQQLDQTGDLLDELAGNVPDEDDVERFTMDAVHLNRELPLSLPSRLVEQRPDVRMAEARLNSVGAKYGVRVVSALPRFTISGATGGENASSTWMLRSGGRFFDTKGNAALVLFGAKAFRAQSRSIRQILEQAGAQYRTVVMAALQEVADTLNIMAADERALKAATRVAQAADSKGEQMRRQYEAGSADFQTLLVAQQNEQLATINLVRAQSNRAGDSIALLQALGGHWWKH